MRSPPKRSATLFLRHSTRSGRSSALRRPSLSTSSALTLRLPARFGPYFIEPVIAGLPPKTDTNPNPKPFIACTDLCAPCLLSLPLPPLLCILTLLHLLVSAVSRLPRTSVCPARPRKSSSESPRVSGSRTSSLRISSRPSPRRFSTRSTGMRFRVGVPSFTSCSCGFL